MASGGRPVHKPWLICDGRRDRDGRRRSRGPVGSHTVFSVIGSNVLANVASLTPGGVGISQAFHVATLHEATSVETASAYSIGQQLLTTVRNIVVAAVLVAVAFGRSGGRQLVGESSARERELQAEARA